MKQQGIISATIHFYRLFLRLYPAGFREEFAGEMVVVFEERIDGALGEGWLATSGIIIRELFGLFSEGVRQRAYALETQPALVAQTTLGAQILGASRRPWSIGLVVVLILIGLGGWLLLRAVMEWWYVNLDGTPDARHVTLADLNGDGHLDAFLSMGSLGDSYWQRDHVMFNDGNGRFSDSGQELGEWNSYSAATGDMNGDGATDVLVANYNGLIRYLNDGNGRFEAYKYWPKPLAVNAALADLNGNGSLDAFLTGCCDPMGKGEITPQSEVWLNDGEGDLIEGGQYLDQARSNAVALGDLNGDGSMDAFLASGRVYVGPPEAPNRVWFNDGQGGFSAGRQQLGNSESLAVALGDLNGDGFLDAVVGNHGPDEVWFNDGQGNFSESDQRLGRDLTWSVILADLDGDSDLDLFVAGETAGRAWFNDGAGRFEASHQRIGYGRYNSVALGDVTGDGLIDVFVSSLKSYQVWRNDGDGRFLADRRTDYG